MFDEMEGMAAKAGFIPIGPRACGSNFSEGADGNRH